jgi:hypothetical protein
MRATSSNAVFQHLCSSSRVSAVVFQHLCFSMFHFCVAASVFASNSRVSASFQHVSLLCCSICVRFQQSCFSIRVPTVVFQHLRFSMFHFCVAASVFASNSRVSAFVFQQSCFSIYVSALVLQHLCSYKQS